MVSAKSYLFALSMGVVAVIITYLEAKNQPQPIPKSTYIKHFILATSISLATVYFGCSSESGKLGAGSGSSGSGAKVFQPEIMTGNPDF
jgi:hypothetical protein